MGKQVFVMGAWRAQMNRVVVYRNADEKAVDEAYGLWEARGLHPAIDYEPRTAKSGLPYRVGNILVPEDEHEQRHAEVAEKLAFKFRWQVVRFLLTLAALVLLWAGILRYVRGSWDRVEFGELLVVPVVVLMALVQLPRLVWRLMTRTFDEPEDR